MAAMMMKLSMMTDTMVSTILMTDESFFEWRNDTCRRMVIEYVRTDLSCRLLKIYSSVIYYGKNNTLLVAGEIVFGLD